MNRVARFDPLGNEVHIWRASLDVPPSLLGGLNACLATDEQQRAQRFHWERDRVRYIVARASLRLILSRYLEVDPKVISFEYDPHGKPSLGRQSDRAGLEFNLSHSDGVALYAFAPGRRVGVDIERIRGDVAWDAIAERFFSPSEVCALRLTATDLQSRAFFDCWTRQEAFVKAIGQGLSMSLRGCEVLIEAGAPARLVTVARDAQEASRWVLAQLDVGPAYAAALAAEGTGLEIVRRDWPVTGHFGGYSH